MSQSLVNRIRVSHRRPSVFQSRRMLQCSLDIFQELKLQIVEIRLESIQICDLRDGICHVALSPSDR